MGSRVPNYPAQAVLPRVVASDEFEGGIVECGFPYFACKRK